MAEILLADLEKSMRTWWKSELAELQKPVSAVVAKAAQDAPIQVAAKVDDKPVTGDLMKTEAETKADMRAAGIAGLVESGDNFRILQFKLGPVTSALVGIPTGMVLGGVINNYLPPYRDAAGVPTKTRPTTIGFGQINLLNPVAHVGGMVASETFVAGLIGSTAAHFITGTLLLNTLLTYTPLGTWLNNFVATLSPKTTVAQSRGGLSAAQVAALRQRHLQEQTPTLGARHVPNGHMTLNPF